MDFLNSIFGFLGSPLVSMGVQALSGAAQYKQASKADAVSARAANTEAAILEADAAVASRQELRMADDAQHKQTMAYLKSGVNLTGSPLLLMEETRRKGIENAKNVTDSASRKAGLIRQTGSVKRASLVNTALDTVGGMQQTYLQDQLLQKQLK